MKFLDKFSKPLKLTNNGIRLPEVVFSDDICSRYNFNKTDSNLSILLTLCRDGFKKKLERGLIDKAKKDEYGERVKYECSVLQKTNFVDYILLVWDVMRFAREENLARGYGRGSAPGSLVNYLIGITDADPVKYGLFFERFISENRAATNEVDGVKYLVGSLPDIDMDFGDEDRDKVIKYVSEKYDGRFVKLSTRGTLTTKILTKEVGKFFGYSEDEMNSITDSIPVIFGKSPKPAACLVESDKYKRLCHENPRILTISEMLYEGINQVGSHASAYSVSFDKLEDFMPCQLGTDGEVVSTYDMYEAQNLSVKLDLLGVQSINLIKRVAEAVGIDLDKVDLNSWDTVYKFLQNLEHGYGLFQISGHTAIRANNKIKPKSIDDTSGLLAIARPGALAFLDQFADYTNNGSIQECPEIFKDVLEKTGGVLIYQESLMQCITKLGFSLIDANTIRDIVGKKKRDKIAEWEPKIFAMAAQNGIPEAAAKYIWDIANASADYSFNRCVEKHCKVMHRDKGEIELQDIEIGDFILAYDTKSKSNHYVEVINIYRNRKKCYKVTLGLHNQSIITSIDHKFFSDGVMIPLKDLKRGSHIQTINGSDWYSVSAPYLEEMDTVDLEVDHPDHNFYCNGIVVSNSHSIAYSLTALLSVYCKFNYPKHFFLEALRMTQKKSDSLAEISEITGELPYFGIKLLPPDLIKSEMDFTIEGDHIRYGLSAIKGVAEKAISKLRQFIDTAEGNKFQVFSAAKAAKLNTTVLSALIQCGCLSSISENRPKLVFEYRIWNELSDREVAFCLSSGDKYDYDLIKALKDYENWNDGKPFKASRLATIRKKTEPHLQIYRKNNEYPEFSKYAYEMALLGFSYSHSLTEIFIKDNPLLQTCDFVKNCMEKDDSVYVVGRVMESKKWKSKSGNDTLKLTINDGTGSLDVMMTGAKKKGGGISTLDAYLSANPVPEEEEIVYVEGKRGDSNVWINRMSIQDYKIALNIKDLKKQLKEKKSKEDSA